jgi:hypothetical protein
VDGEASDSAERDALDGYDLEIGVLTLRAGVEEWLERVDRGECIGTFVVGGGEGRCPVEQLAARLSRAVSTGARALRKACCGTPTYSSSTSSPRVSTRRPLFACSPASGTPIRMPAS